MFAKLGALAVLALVTGGILSLFFGFRFFGNGFTPHDGPTPVITTHVTTEVAPPAPKDTWHPIPVQHVSPVVRSTPAPVHGCTTTHRVTVTVNSKGQQSTSTTNQTVCK